MSYTSQMNDGGQVVFDKKTRKLSIDMEYIPIERPKWDTKLKGDWNNMPSVQKITMKKDFGSLKKDQEYTVDDVRSHIIMVQDNDGNIMGVPQELGSLSSGIPINAVSAGTVGATISDDEVDILSALLDDDEIDMTSVRKSTNGAPAEPLPPKPKLKKNQRWLSDITGGTLPKNAMDHIITIYANDAFDKDIRCDIPEEDPNYIWDADIFEMLYFAHKLNKKCLLTGYPGTGKSSAIKQYAAIIKQPYMRFNGKDGIEPSSFLGMAWANGAKEGMVWKDGLLPIGMKSDYLVTIDEVFKLPAGIQMAMQCVYEEGGYLVLDDKPGTLEEKRIVPSEHFRLFLTDNVKGTGDDFDKFAATQMQDTSTLDRVSMVGEMVYLPEKQEVKLLKDKYGMQTIIAGKLVKFAGLVRAGYKKSEIGVTLSPRGLFTIAELMNEGMPVMSAIYLAFYNKLGEDSERIAIKQFIDTVRF